MFLGGGFYGLEVKAKIVLEDRGKETRRLERKWKEEQVNTCVAGEQQECFRRVTGMLQVCYCCVSFVAQGCNWCVTGVLQGCYWWFSFVSQGCVRCVSGVLEVSSRWAAAGRVTWETSLWFSLSHVSLMAALRSKRRASCSSFSWRISSVLNASSRSCSAFSRRSHAWNKRATW